jgi:hypothetical protein
VRRRDDTGQTSVLIVGFFLVAVLLLAVVVDASAAYLARQRLDAIADGAALAATEGLEGDQVYVGGLEERAEIDPGEARRHVAAYLRQTGAHRDHPGLSVRVRTTADSVTVRVSSPLALPLVPPGWTSSARVTGHAAAYVQVVE